MSRRDKHQVVGRHRWSSTNIRSAEKYVHPHPFAPAHTYRALGIVLVGTVKRIVYYSPHILKYGLIESLESFRRAGASFSSPYILSGIVAENTV